MDTEKPRLKREIAELQKENFELRRTLDSRPTVSALLLAERERDAYKQEAAILSEKLDKERANQRKASAPRKNPELQRLKDENRALRRRLRNG